MMHANTVLVVDDEPTNIEIVAAVLETEYEIAFATSGEHALELMPTVQPDIILLDVMLPGMDGHQVLAKLKADPHTAGIPVIFITGRDDHDDETHGLELGAADYITKPFSPTVIRARVRNQVELRRLRQELELLAASDGLTGLANRRAFDIKLEMECKRLGRTGGTLSLIMIDVDHFKAFNDAYGHVAGDECLRTFAGFLSGALRRPPDVGARYGGEEFACVLPDTDVDGALLIATRIQDDFTSTAIPHKLSPTASYVTVSIGVASIVCTPMTQPVDVITTADACLYRAKQSGRNQIVTPATANV